MNKKGDLSFGKIISLILLVVVLFFLILFVKKYYGSEAPTTKIINTQIDFLGDYDDDKVSNREDKCPCTAVGSEQQTGLPGCPKGTTVDQAQDNQQKFKEQKCSEVAAHRTEQSTQILYLEISPTISPESYETTNTFLRYTFTCPPNIQCSLRIMEPGGGIRPDIQAGAVNDLVLVNGQYVFDLLGESDQVLKTVTVTKK